MCVCHKVFAKEIEWPQGQRSQGCARGARKAVCTARVIFAHINQAVSTLSACVEMVLIAANLRR